MAAGFATAELHATMCEQMTFVKKTPCAQHPSEAVTMFCKSHRAFLCSTCAILGHLKECTVVDIAGVKAEWANHLQDLIQRGKARIAYLQQRHGSFEETASHARGVLDRVRKDAEAALEDDRKRVHDERRHYAEEINRKADEAIQKINDKRNDDLLKNEAAYDEKLSLIDVNEELLSEDLTSLENILDDIDEQVIYRITELTAGLNDATEKVNNLLVDNEKLINDFNDYSVFLTRYLREEFDFDGIENVLQTVQKVNFCREESVLHVGRIDGVKQWELIDRWNSNDVCDKDRRANRSVMVGCISAHEVVIGDHEHISVTDLCERTTTKVLTKPEELNITNCVRLSDERIVCGHVTGTVAVYNNKWELVNQPAENESMEATEPPHVPTLVTSTRNKLILTSMKGTPAMPKPSLCDRYQVQVINIAVPVKFQMYALASGDIAVHAECQHGKDLCVSDMSGKVKDTVHLHEKDMTVWSLAVDRAHDHIFILYTGPQGATCHVDVMSPTGEILSKKIVSFAWEGGYPQPSLAIPSSNKIVIFHRGRYRVYSKRGQDVIQQALDVFRTSIC